MFDFFWDGVYNVAVFNIKAGVRVLKFMDRVHDGKQHSGDGEKTFLMVLGGPRQDRAESRKAA